jgi:hypothetical protein
MVRIAPVAHITLMAAVVDIWHYPFSDKRVIFCLLHDAHEFMTKSAMKGLVTA